jgi:Ser/Thr protein kinase RdoA (MazF antagonist)
MAMTALESYDLEVVSIRPLSTAFNTTFRVDTVDGRRYVLRINRPGHRTEADIRSELTWLDALRRETDLIVSEPVHRRDGELIATLEAPGVPEPRHCALFHWIDGRGARRKPLLKTVFEMGRALARLHEHADRFAPPAGFTEHKLNRVWPKGRPEAVYDDRPDERFSPQQREVLRRAANRVDAALTRLYADPAGLRFLHADLHPGNIMLTRSGLAVIDFDDSLWCYPVQDAGISFFYLQYYPNTEELRDAFRRGYESLRAWPDPAGVATFAAARQLELISTIAATTDPGLAAYLPRTLEIGVPKLVAWLNEYVCGSRSRRPGLERSVGARG